MGMKKLARKRLFDVEKKGINLDSGVSEAMKKALVYATQHREGQKLISELLFDFGSSTAGLKTKALAAADPIGPASGASFLCTIKNSIFGVVTTVETICLEAITDGTLTDYDLMFAGDGDLDGDTSSGNDGSLGSDATNDTLLKANIGALGQHEIMSVQGTDFTANQLSNKFLYLTSGGATSQKATATIDCTNADIDNIVSGITRIRLQQNDALANTTDIVADSSKNKSSTTDNFFGMSDVTTTAHLAASLAAGIGGTDGGSGDYTASNPTATTVLITHHASTATNNGTNFLVDDPEKASGIVVGNFTGGIDDGVAITSGKLLIRITGFADPADL